MSPRSIDTDVFLIVSLTESLKILPIIIYEIMYNSKKIPITTPIRIKKFDSFQSPNEIPRIDKIVEIAPTIVADMIMLSRARFESPLYHYIFYSYVLPIFSDP